MKYVGVHDALIVVPGTLDICCHVGSGRACFLFLAEEGPVRYLHLPVRGQLIHIVTVGEVIELSEIIKALCLPNLRRRNYIDGCTALALTASSGALCRPPKPLKPDDGIITYPPPIILWYLVRGT